MLAEIGDFFNMWKRMLSRPDNNKMFLKEYINNCYDIGFGALPIVLIVSFFLGAVTTVQTAYQLVSPFVPLSTIGEIVRDSMILELSPTMVCLMLAGIVGSKISSELGNMRLTEQIDALEVMGINSTNYLVLPKILASITIIPMLVAISMFVGILGGRIIGELSNVMSTNTFDDGIRLNFNSYNVFFAMIKAYTFSIIISSISAYFGYFTKGSALEIGRSGTKAVVLSSVLILAADFFLAQILL
ncbi:MAG: ABC transporter permease [Sediminibacterium sp.]|nr:ABC transporter permease [Sediminibacterium sp.]